MFSVADNTLNDILPSLISSSRVEVKNDITFFCLSLVVGFCIEKVEEVRWRMRSDEELVVNGEKKSLPEWLLKQNDDYDDCDDGDGESATVYMVVK